LPLFPGAPLERVQSFLQPDRQIVGGTAPTGVFSPKERIKVSAVKNSKIKEVNFFKTKILERDIKRSPLKANIAEREYCQTNFYDLFCLSNKAKLEFEFNLFFYLIAKPPSQFNIIKL
jgi:hypothetical protein